MISKLFAIFFILIFLFKSGFSQTEQSDQIKYYTVKVFADAEDWTSTGIKVKKGDFVMFEPTGLIDLGFFHINERALGTLDPFIQHDNRYPYYHHGVLLCQNSDTIIPVETGQSIFHRTAALNNSEDPYDNQYLYPINFNPRPIPAVLNKDLINEKFLGNYFISNSDQELNFIVNDKIIDDNSGHFDIKVTIYSMNACPRLDGKFDLARYIDTNDANVPFCFEDDCLPKYSEYQNQSGGLWFEGKDEGGHYYLTINPLGAYSYNISDAINIIKTRIYDIFPGRAVDQESKANPEKSTIQLNHNYDLLYEFTNVAATGLNVERFLYNMEFLPPISDLPPIVKVINDNPYHFTFEADPKHILQGTAVHGLFKDKCGKLFMFQQGRGIPDENWFSKNNSTPIAYIMWQIMAYNMKEVLGIQ